MASTLSIFVDGPATLFIGAQNCSATAYTAVPTQAKELGITESGVQCSVNTLTHRVNSDDCGGSEGNPADLLIMGSTGTVRGTLVKYNATAFPELLAGLYGVGTEGQTRLPGTAIFSNNYGFGLWVVGYGKTLYFPKCEFATSPREFNISSTERKTSFTINAYPVMTSGAVALYFAGAGDASKFYPGCANVVGANNSDS